MIDKNADTYDRVAKHYHLWFDDWRKAVESEGKRLDALLRPRGVRTVLDCTCGTGPQCLGLAILGYSVTGCDSSPGMLREARRNARNMGLKVRWVLGDIRTLQESIPGTFDAVITCGNSLAHLLTQEDLVSAASSMYRATNPGGCCLIEACDYESMVMGRPSGVYSRAVEADGRRAVLYDRRTYGPETLTAEFNLLLETGKGWKAKQFVMKLHPWSKPQLREALIAGGFGSVNDFSAENNIQLLASRDVRSYHQKRVLPKYMNSVQKHD